MYPIQPPNDPSHTRGVLSASRPQTYQSYALPPSSDTFSSSRSTQSPHPSSTRRDPSASSLHPSPRRTSSYSYDLFNVTPDEGLIHQRSSEQDDLDNSRSRPRTSSSSDALRRYACLECGKRFVKPSTLKVSVHNILRPTTQMLRLAKNHSLTHTGEKREWRKLRPLMARPQPVFSSL